MKKSVKMPDPYVMDELAVSTAPGSEPLNRQVYHLLKLEIIECRLKPGDRLSENDVAARFRISRQPVREALIKLGEDNFVIIRPKRTTRVAPISRSDIDQGVEIRMALETHIAGLAATLIKPEHIKALDENVQSQRYVAQQYKLREHFALDDAFHRQVIEASGISKAWGIVESYKGVMDRLRFLSLEYELTPMVMTSNAHSRILEALRAGNSDAAVAAMREHLEQTRRSLLTAMSKCKSDWFCD